VPTLEFKGKPFVYSHHLSVPFRELRIDAEKSLPGAAGPNLDDNLIVHGDNLEALKALLPRYAGKVDVIYIDPPYNTGKDDWRYNDRVSSPLMEAWLGSIVNKEDMERHDKWLCMMWPRLQLLKDLLAPHGVMFVSIDDNELCSLRLMLDEVFGGENWLGTLIWKNATDNNPTRIAIEHEYVLCIARDISAIRREWKNPFSDIKDLMLTEFDRLKGEASSASALSKAWNDFVKDNKTALGDLYRYRRIDEHGPYVARRNLDNPGKPGYDYDVFHPKTKKPCEKPYWGWRFSPDAMKTLLEDDRIIFGKDESKIPELKVPLREVGFPLRSVINLDSRAGSNELNELFGNREVFKNPKPSTLIEQLLSYVSTPDSLIVDSFAGSGTTAHAVLALNKADGGNRRFVLVQLPEDLPTEASAFKEGYKQIIDITAERVRRVIKGVPGAKNVSVRDGRGGSFTYCELGDEMNLERFFAGDGSAPAWDRLAEYVAYTATGATLTASEEGPDGYAGEAGGFRLHLIYRPDQAWMRSNEAMLDMATAERIAAAANGQPVLVFAAGKLMAQNALTRTGLTFCQLPYSIHRVLGDGTEGVAGVDAA
jgi:adenine-specific DNA-methyltransferase